MTRVISVRIPSEWEARVSAERARSWVTAWLQRPEPLVDVPGPGAYKLNLRLTDAQVKELQRRSGRSTSAALRGILALNISATPAVVQKRGLKWLLGGLASGVVLFLVIAAGVGPSARQRR